MKNSILFVFLSILMLTDIQVYAQSSSKSDEVYGSLEWRNIGPFRGGRSCAVTGVPNMPNLFYFGSTGGGIWKTEDGGRAWENISDGFFGGSIGSIAVAPSDKNVIYVGGGEKTVRGNVSFGYGVWKSVNGGKSWTEMGLKTSRHIARIRINPNNPDIVFAAVMGDLFKPTEDRGVYKSMDGGKTWKKVLFSNADAGAVDLIIDPTNHRIMYATTWNIRRTPYSLSSGGDGSALWKSTDQGETWTNISDAEGLPKGVWGISGVAVSPIDGDRIFAMIENKDGGLYRSDDGGKKWTKVNSKRALRQRAWYYTRVYADTEDIDVVYVLNVRYHKSVDGGKTFKTYNAPHGDHHDLWIAPENPKRMIIGDDGGAQVTYDGGETWSTYHNQPTSQFYRVTTDDHFPYRILVAQQDNSTLRIAHRTTGGSIGEDDWERTAGGESAHIAVDPKDNDIVYGGSYDGFLTRLNHRTGSVRAVNVWPDNPMGHGAEDMKYRFQWNFPIFFSKHNPDKLYTASQHLHVSTDEGQTWEIISPDLTRSEPEKLKSSGGPITQDNTSVEYYATIFAAQESSLKEGLIWVGSDDGRIHVTQDGGTNWTDVTSSKMPKYLMINSIEPSPFDEATCYVAGTLYKAGDYLPYLFVTRDFGKTWKKITNGIPSEHFTRVLRADPEKQGFLYAGTESGMYISMDDGANWTSFQLNLPIVPITDLTIKQNNLIASTQGRGIWLIDDLTVMHQYASITKKEQHHLFQPMDAWRMGGFQVKNPKGAGKNHPGGVMTHFYLHEYDKEKDTISISYINAENDTIKTYSTHSKEKRDKLEVKQGGNMHSWNLSYPPAKNVKGMILWWGSLNGPKAKPGTYRVALNINGDTMEQSFNVMRRPNSEGTIEDINAQFEFVKSINDKLNEAHQAIIDIRSLRGQMKAYLDKVDDEEVNEYGTEVDSLMTKIEEALYQTKNRSGQDPLNFPIRLTNKLAHLNSLTQMGTNDFPPTAGAIAVRNELNSLIDDELNDWNSVKTTMLPKLNDMIRQKALDIIILDTKE
ncbi:MAG: glycosyl hydrolase [Saprospiraceae bacterium]|nr:glycosyl hydrolase [Saprospiraceae bacterium]